MSQSSEFAKPITDVPTTIGRAIDLRGRVEKRINTTSVQHSAKNPFWATGTKPEPATRIVQSVLDRHQVLFELNETISFVSASKDSDVVIPALLQELKPYRLTLGQLRDAGTYLIPYLSAVEKLISSQINTVTTECSKHDLRIDQELKNEITELEKQFKIKSENAKLYNETVPSEDDLKNDIQTAKRRADTKRAVKIDSIGVKEFLGALRPILSFLTYRINDSIDACNAQTIDSELKQMQQERAKSLDAIKNGKSIEFTCGTVASDVEVLSVANLRQKIDDFKGCLNSAIDKLVVVSYKKGLNGKVENPNVEHGKERLITILRNIEILNEYKKTHRVALSSNFVVLHPLTSTPCSVDSLIRLGYENKASEWEVPVPDEHINLYNTLSKLETLLNTANTSMETEKEEYEKRIRTSISEKLDSRSKSGAQLKGAELEEIAKAVRSSDVKEFYLSEGIDEAKTRVSNLLETVTSLQSAERKSANALISVAVRQSLPMTWVETDEFAGW